MSSAVTKLQSSFDVDVYKNSLEILQKGTMRGAPLPGGLGLTDSV